MPLAPCATGSSFAVATKAADAAPTEGGGHDGGSADGPGAEDGEPGRDDGTGSGAVGRDDGSGAMRVAA